MIEAALLLAATAITGWAYLAGVRRIWDHAGRHRTVRAWQPGCFLAGLVAIVAVLVGPLDTMADTSLTAHMIQHMVLVVVAAPLLVVAAPVPALLWGLPDGRVRRRLSRWSRALTRSRHAGRGMGWAAAAFGLHAVALWAWHLPPAYQAALAHPAFHAVEHLSFLGTAIFLWWTIAAANRRAAYGLGVVALFFTAFQGTALGAAMTLAPHPWYPHYSRPGARWSLSPLEDQQLAGVVMWGFAGFAYVVAAAGLFVAWLQGWERHSPARGPAGGGRGPVSRGRGPVSRGEPVA